MKEKITNSAFVKWIAGLKISQWLSRNRFTGKFCNYEFITYIICGVLTTVVSYVVFFLLGSLSAALANTISFVAAVLFAYVVNKIFVFDSPSWKIATVAKEFLSFVVMRILSWAVETGFLWLMCDHFRFSRTWMKILASVFVIIVNYFTSKFLVFRKTGDSNEKSND